MRQIRHAIKRQPDGSANQLAGQVCGGQRRVQTSGIVDAASMAAMAPLRMRRARGVWRKRCSAAPNASQGKQLGEGHQHKQDRDDDGLGQGTAGAPVEEGGDGSDADQPPLGVDPLEGCHAEESSRCVRGPSGISRGRDPPGHPAQRRRPGPLQDLQHPRMSKEQVAQPQGDSEQHRAHPDHLPQQAHETLPDTDRCQPWRCGRRWS
jgi:hypothetical protein